MKSQGTLFDGGPDPAPFYRWTGTKRRYVRELQALLGSLHGLEYREAFLGSGALALRLLCDGAARKVWLNDRNAEIVATWRGLRECPDEVVRLYREHLKANSETHYYAVRDVQAADLGTAERAARFLYLVGAGHCGLWRENRAGEMNTPYGHASQVFTPETRLREVSELLRRCPETQITAGGFEAVFAGARPGVVIYGDPPYLPLPTAEPAPDESKKKKGPSFTSYAGAFSEDDHRRLAELSEKAARAGARVRISNHDTPLSRKIYAGARGLSVSATRGFGASGKAPEVVFVYDPK